MGTYGMGIVTWQVPKAPWRRQWLLKLTNEGFRSANTLGGLGCQPSTERQGTSGLMHIGNLEKADLLEVKSIMLLIRCC